MLTGQIFFHKTHNPGNSSFFVRSFVSTMNNLACKKLRNNVILPHRARTSDAGFDVCACLYPTANENQALQNDRRAVADENDELNVYLRIEVGGRAVIPTGISVSCPESVVWQVWPRSGLAKTKGISVMAGLIDSSYRGEVMVILRNDGTEYFLVKQHMKIAQLVPVVVANPGTLALTEMSDLSESSRGNCGFGSSGI